MGALSRVVMATPSVLMGRFVYYGSGCEILGHSMVFRWRTARNPRICRPTPATAELASPGLFESAYAGQKPLITGWPGHRTHGLRKRIRYGRGENYADD